MLSNLIMDSFSLCCCCYVLIQEAYAKYVKEYYIDYIGADVETYDQQHLKKAINSSDRLWWFQVCTEVAYFQVAPANDSIRSSKVDTRQVYMYYVPSVFPFFLMFRYYCPCAPNYHHDIINQIE